MRRFIDAAFRELDEWDITGITGITGVWEVLVCMSDVSKREHLCQPSPSVGIWD